MDLQLLKKYSSGELSPREFLSVHREAGELLDLLHQSLQRGEDVVSVADWPSAKRRSPRQFLALKTLMLVTPLIIFGGVAFAWKYPLAVMVVGVLWLAAFLIIAMFQLLRRQREKNSLEDRSVLVVTNRRLMRVWLDGTGEIQSFSLSDEKPADGVVEPVPETVKLLLQLELGKTSLN